MGAINRVLRAVTFSLGAIIVVFFMNEIGLKFFPDVFFTLLGFLILTFILIFGAFDLEV